MSASYTFISPDKLSRLIGTAAAPALIDVCIDEPFWPACASLAASLGLSRMFNDDLEQLNAGFLLYGAFYR